MSRIITVVIFMVFLSCRDAQVSSVSTAITEDRMLPSVFDNGDRIFLKIPTIGRDTIHVFTDTGGGFTAIYPDAIDKLGLKESVFTESMDGEQIEAINAEDIIVDEVYYPYLNQAMRKNIEKPFYFVPRPEFVRKHAEDELNEGFFGQFLFMDKIWTFDYQRKEVTLHASVDLNESDKHTQRIGFKKDMMGNPKFGHPSFTMKVEGKDLPMLFDTGASFNLSDTARDSLNSKSTIGGSFIAESIFREWKDEHPEWRIIEGGDVIKEGDNTYAFDMIEVPVVELGGIEVGPTWFSMRPDAAWSKGMIRTMDKVVKGALGGSALKYLSVTIDYKNELLSFNKK